MLFTLNTSDGSLWKKTNKYPTRGFNEISAIKSVSHYIIQEKEKAELFYGMLQR